MSQPLIADAAVQIALLRNPRIQSGYARLGIAEANVYEASRISGSRASCGDYRDPGWYANPEETVAWRVRATGQEPEADMGHMHMRHGS